MRISLRLGLSIILTVAAVVSFSAFIPLPKEDTLWWLLAQTAALSGVVLLAVRWTLARPVAELTDWMRQARAGNAPPTPRVDLLSPLAREAETFARHLERARSAAAEEARLRRNAEMVWTPERLQQHVAHRLNGRSLVVVSNREPYMHMKKGAPKEWIVPAGGLVTALEPVLRTAGGTWIAHGSGAGDFDVVDDHDRLAVPPDEPKYTLRRVRLTPEEEKGYYYGFANEGLWPLCHIAHTRPVFRPEDWKQYQVANNRFAQAVLEEIRDHEAPCVLVQDYHLALLPRLIKEARPDARVALFWHIPWPNAEALAICPWQADLLRGLLGADVVGFHTQSHCNNFLDTVDQTLEARVDWENFAVEKEGHRALVKPFPISVAFPSAFQDVEDGGAAPGPEALARMLGFVPEFLGVGVERMDYTKGVIEKFRGIERFLDKYPAYLGRFAFVQIGAPSRTDVPRYKEFLAEVEAEAERINAKFRSKPIHFLKRHHSHREILPLYRAANVCLVTSLHDGMNLVAKEFVAAREDVDGVLILSRFTGASRELSDALLVNPYHVDQLADAIRYALEMDREERMSRMRRLRAVVRENNIYRWAGDLIEALSRVDVEKVGAGGG